ncbi:MAG TPA: NBR1-Ig-like domain-containing protein, partial [Chloroflexaceae bacterium]|nr:NBR1-Ig-like domain-containing protein [Chloroflexaceae bacterium]
MKNRQQWLARGAMVLVLALFDALLPRAAAGQAQPFIDDADRRVILVPGIIFNEPFASAEDQLRVNACYRAIEQTFDQLHGVLTDLTVRARYLKNRPLPGLPLYKPEQIYAIDYSITVTPNEPCVRYQSYIPAQGDGERAAPVMVDHDRDYRGPVNDNQYQGKDTQTRLVRGTDSELRQEWPGLGPDAAEAVGGYIDGTPERFGQQFTAWRKDCPDCHFDLVAHSLGGAVIARWIDQVASDEDRARVHAVITIDSPVNGIDKFVVDPQSFLIRFEEGRKIAGGLVPVDLADKDFIASMRRAPTKVDMRCLSNLYDALIPPYAATIRNRSDSLFYPTLAREVPYDPEQVLAETAQLQGPCQNMVGRLSIANPFTRGVADAEWRDLVGKAHTQPTDDLLAIFLVAQQIARDTEQWAARNALLRAALEGPVPTGLAAPGTVKDVSIALRNTGTAIWKPNQVELRLVAGEGLGLAEAQPINATVRPGEAITLTLALRAPGARGAYQSTWQLARGTSYFGPRLRSGLVVLPASELSPDKALEDPLAVLRAMVDSFIDDMQRRAQAEIHKWTAALRGRAVGEVWRAVCGAVPA